MSGGNGGMMFFMKILKGIQSSLAAFVNFCTRKLTVPETGRLPVSRSTLRSVGIAFLIIVALAVILNNTFNNYIRKADMSDYKKEVVVDPAVALPQINDADLERNTPYDIMNNGEKNITSSSGGGVAEGLTKEDCLALIQRLKDGDPKFSIEENQKINTCIDSNIAGLSEKELALAKALSDPTLMEAQRQALRDKWNSGQTNSKDKQVKQLINGMDNAASISKSLAGRGLDVASGKITDLIRQLQKEGKNKDLGGKVAENKKLSAKDLEDIKKALEAAGLVSAANAANGKDGTNGNGVNGSGANGANSVSDLKALADKIRDQQTALAEARKEAAEAQAAAREAAKNIMDGKLLTAEQQAAINRSNEANKKAADAQAALNESLRSAKDLADALKKNMDSITSVTTDVASFSTEGRYKIKGAAGKKAPVKLTDRQLDAIKFRDISNQLLGGVQVESRILNNVPDGTPIDPKKLIVSADTKDRITLDSKAKIPAIIVSEIMYAAGGPNQQVRVRVLENMFDVETNKIAIPKNQILLAQASTFSEETGIMDLRFSKVRVGKKVYDVAISVGSADGTSGLKGDVYSRTGQKLLAALVTSFSAGVLSWFSSDISNRYGQARSFGQAATGASLSGAAEVGNKIATQMASNLNNIPAVFYVPAGTNIVLFPED